MTMVYDLKSLCRCLEMATGQFDSFADTLVAENVFSTATSRSYSLCASSIFTDCVSSSLVWTALPPR